MIQKTEDSKPEVFMVTVVPISKHITTENMMQKLGILFGGIGIKVVELEPMPAGDMIPKDIAIAILDDIEANINADLFDGLGDDQSGQDGGQCTI